MNIDLVRKIARIGELYYHQEEDSAAVLNDWWESWKYLSGRMYFQGRRDIVSSRVRESADSILEPVLKKGIANLNDDGLKRIESQLSEVIGPGKIGRGNDIKMILSVLKYCIEKPSSSIVARTKFEIERGRLREHYLELKSIFQFGPKITSFYLRDVVDLFQLESFIDEDDFVLLHPVDTWVRKIAEKIGLATHENSINTIQRAITKACIRGSVFHTKFNQGAWYLGAKGTEVALDILERKLIL
ncbi:MAG: hypothetical protein ACFFFC_04025 [Candidatus Thorarchaeota archaeon]